MKAVETFNLTKKFGNITAVDSVSFDVKSGEIFGLLGPNGAGKTTLVRLLCGLLKPTDGYAVVGGYDIRKDAEKVKQIIGYMSQKFGLYDDLTVEENISFYAGIYLNDRKLAKERTEQIIKELSFERYRKTLAAYLSGGWRQRLSFATAIVHRPKIVFLDEPTSGVDPVSRRHFWELVYELSRSGTTVFVTTHYMDEAERCNRVGFILNGKLIAVDTPTRIKMRYLSGEVISVVVENIMDTYREFLELGFVRDVSVFGDSVHLVVDSADKRVDEIKKMLKSKGIKFTKIEKIIPSIEDVFVSLTKEIADFK